MVQVEMNEEEFRMWEKFAAEEEDAMEYLADEADDAVKLKKKSDGSVHAETV